MTQDIVERLRSGQCWERAEQAKAADVIERLRAEIAKLQAEIEELQRWA